MKKIFLLSVHLLAWAFCLWYLIVNRSQLGILLKVSTLEMILLLAATGLYLLATGYTFKRLVNLLDVKLTWNETMGLSVITNFGNYLGPTSPGSAIKAVYLKSVKGLVYAKFFSVFVANNFFGFFMLGMAGTALYVWLEQMYSAVPSVLLLYSLTVMIVCSLPLLWRIPSSSKKGRIAEIWRSAAEGYNSLFNQPQKLSGLALSYLGQFAVRSWIFSLAFSSVERPIGFGLALSLAVYTSMFDFYLTPNNLGIQETLGAYVLSVSGIDFTEGVMGLALVRVAHLLTTFLLTPFFAPVLLKRNEVRFGKIL